MLHSSPRFSEAVEFGQSQNFPLSCGAYPPHGVSELPAVCTGVLENSLPGALRLSKWPFSKTALSLRGYVGWTGGRKTDRFFTTISRHMTAGMLGV
ncbi:unnamed protein product [Gadus morhua 'NCC']